MSFVPTDHCWEVTMRGTLAGRIPWVSSLFLDSTGSVLTQGGADTVGGMVGDAWEDSGLLGFLSTGWILTDYLVTDLTASTSPQFASTVGNQVGTDGTQVLPGQTAAMIDWRTASRGKSFRGRSFFCGFTEAASDGLPLAGVVTALNTFASGLIGDAATAGLPLVVNSRFSGTHLAPGRKPGVVRSVPTARNAGVKTLITSGAGETVWKTQRRRAFPG